VIDSALALEFLAEGRSQDCPVVALHGHLGDFSGAHLPSESDERVLRSMRRSGVTRMACAHHVAMMYDLVAGNRRMQEAIDEHPDELLGLWVVNPNFPAQMAADIEAFEATRGFIGFKVWADYHLSPITSPKYAPAFEYADQRGLVQLVHTWAGSRFDKPELLGEVAGRYPGATFLMGHSGHGDFETAAAVARDHDNVYLELSSVPDPHDYSMMPGGTLMPSGTPISAPQVSGVIEYLVEVAGSHKLVFGSDLPWYSLSYHIGAIVFARISENAKHDILHRNAERILAARPGTSAAVMGG
jgi:predicted TIM-barrel fold metal-dependent hydrolase